MDVGKPSIITKVDGIDKPSVSFQLWSVSEDSKAAISLKGVFCRVCYVVLYQGYCGLVNTTYLKGRYMISLQSRTKSLIAFITLVDIICQSRE